MTGPISAKTTQDKALAEPARLSKEPDQLHVAASAYGGIMALQRAAGNRAVDQLLRPSGDEPVRVDSTRAGDC